jgi:hypothetical protein
MAPFRYPKEEIIKKILLENSFHNSVEVPRISGQTYILQQPNHHIPNFIFFTGILEDPEQPFQVYQRAIGADLRRKRIVYRYYRPSARVVWETPCLYGEYTPINLEDLNGR